MEIIDILKSNELFRGLEANELAIVAALTSQKTVLKNTLVVSEGENFGEIKFQDDAPRSASIAPEKYVFI